MDFVLVDESVAPGDAGTYAQGEGAGVRAGWAVGVKGERGEWVRSAVGVLLDTAWWMRLGRTDVR